MIEGLDHIASLLRLYDIRARLRHETTVDEYRVAIVQLYAHILEYEVRMACHLAKHTMSRGVHSIMHSGLWPSLVKKIDSADQYCQQHEVLIDKALERAEWKKQSEHMERSHKIQEQILDAMRNFLDTRAAVRERMIARRRYYNACLRTTRDTKTSIPNVCLRRVYGSWTMIVFIDGVILMVRACCGFPLARAVGSRSFPEPWSMRCYSPRR